MIVKPCSQSFHYLVEFLVQIIIAALFLFFGSMVSKDFSKESPSTIIRQCLISNMDSNPVQTEGFAYGPQCQPNIIPFFYNPQGEEHIGVNHRNGYGLSLTLGSLHPSEFQNDRLVNAASTHCTSSSNVICADEINSRVCNTSNLSSQTLHDMASIVTFLQNSPYIKPAQQLLDEVVCVSNAVELGHARQVRRSFEIARATESINLPDENQHSSEEKHAVHIKINKLSALLDQLENRYEQYFHQMDTTVSSFEAMAGAGAAASYTALTIQAMSKHFSNLRDAIITQLNVLRDSLFKDQPKRQKKENLHQLSMIQIHQVWRPLRGLPEESVSLLRSWLFEHFLHPYPTDNEKLMLASQTGLTRNQISNWFINARVRLWKPMIEEMYREEFAGDLQD